MVCPLEPMLRPAPVRVMVRMDSPELKTIGDARGVIDVQRVTTSGATWSGADRGAYR